MTLHYAGKHRAPRMVSPARRAGTGVAAAAALGIAAPVVSAVPAMANAPVSTNDAPASEAPTTESSTTESTTEAPATESSTTESSTTESSSADSTSTGSGLVQPGDTGEDVREVQEQVDVTVDGVYGSKTQAAVMDFQGSNGLATDGIVGPETQAALTGGSSSDAGDAGAASEGTSSEGTGSDDSFSEGAASEDTGSDDSVSDEAVTVSTASADSDESAEVSTASADTGETATVTNASTDSADSGSASSGGVLATAESLVGTPYVYGGDDPSGFDCSGFTQYVFAQNGKDLPRMTQDQQAVATPTSNPQPGDLVFMGSPAYHVGIYAGDGMMYDAGNEDSDTVKREIWTDNVTYGSL